MTPHTLLSQLSSWLVDSSSRLILDEGSPQFTSAISCVVPTFDPAHLA